MRAGYFSEYELDCAPDGAVERLAKFMGVAPERLPGELAVEYFVRCKEAVLDEGIRLANLPKPPKGAWML